MVYSPIWKDTYYTANTETLAYEIRLDGNVIYSGRAIKKPDADVISININKICRNYLESDIRSMLENNSTSIRHNEAIRDFYLYNQSGTQLERYEFLLCYDYDFVWNGATGATLSLPVMINGHYVKGMFMPATVISGTTTQRYEATQALREGLGYNTPVCGDVLYYLNARGGWNAFVFEGVTKKTDNLTTYNTDRVFNNTTLDFENNRYISEIKTTYELNTHMLGDEESARYAKHLVGSNKCYLHKMDEGWIKPVVIKDNSVAYQTYQGNGRKLSQYKLNVELSQTQIRK